MNNLIEIKNLNKSYPLHNSGKIKIIENLSFIVKQKSNVSIIGPSGSGKSTLLNIIGLLDSDYTGSYFLKDLEVKRLEKSKLNLLRGISIGFVHQFFHLIPELTVLENVMLPGLINKKSYQDSYKDSLELLKIFELEERLNFKPVKLSGGEQQRVAISRSLVNNPDLLLADEMTGNLDENTAEEIFNFFLKYINKNKTSLIYVTHNKKFSKMAEEQYYLKDKSLFKINE